MKNTLVFLLPVAVLLGGCTTAGPYVTNVSSDGQGNIIIEKNTVRMNAFTGAITAGENPTVQNVRVCTHGK